MSSLAEFSAKIKWTLSPELNIEEYFDTYLMAANFVEIWVRLTAAESVLVGPKLDIILLGEQP
jgi:hypothetical protein